MDGVVTLLIVTIMLHHSSRKREVAWQIIGTGETTLLTHSYIILEIPHFISSQNRTASGAGEGTGRFG